MHMTAPACRVSMLSFSLTALCGPKVQHMSMTSSCTQVPDEQTEALSAALALARTEVEEYKEDKQIPK